MSDLYFHELVFRPRATHAAHIPLGARSVGNYRINRGSHERFMVKHFVEVFWGVEGRGVFVVHRHTGDAPRPFRMRLIQS